MSEFTLLRRSAVPGRERWHVAQLRGQSALMEDVAKRLRECTGMTLVAVNPGIGSILICFDPEAASFPVEPVLRSALASSLDGREGSGLAAQAPHSPAAVGPGTLAVGAVAGSVALALFGAPTSLVVGGVVGLVTAGLVRHGWNDSRWRRPRSSPGGALVPEVVSGEHPIHRLLALDPRFASQARAATLCSVATKVLNTVPPVLLGVAVSIVSAGPSALLASLGIATLTGQIWAITLVGAVFWTAEAGLELKAGRMWRGLARKMQHELRMQGYRHVQDLELDVLHNQRIGKLTSILNDDVNQVHAFFDAGAHDVIQLATNLVVIGPLCYILAPGLAWVAVLPIPLIIWMSFRFERQAMPFFRRMREQAGIVSAQLVTNLDGLPVVRSFVTEDMESARIERMSLEYAEAQGLSDEKAARFMPSVRMVMLGAWAGTILGGGHQVAAGTLSAGVYATLVTLTQRVLWPLVGLGRTVDSYQRSMAAASRVLELLELPPPAPAASARRLARSDVKGEVVFDHVSFAYAGRDPVYEDLSLRFEAEKTSAIVGATGAGKTTLIKLLVRFHDVGGGRILLDGVDIRDRDVHDLRRAVGVVSQDPFLFEGSIRDNIAYGRLDAGDEEMRRAAELAEVHAFAEALPNGYDTIVGERGVKLSGGQRQRICLARAILKDPPILVLDEATSAVDNETEVAIQRALTRISVGRTTIVVAHRLSTIRRADVIYVLDRQGRLAESGAHDELVLQRGIYASLWAVQSGHET